MIATYWENNWKEERISPWFEIIVVNILVLYKTLFTRVSSMVYKMARGSWWAAVHSTESQFITFSAESNVNISFIDFIRSKNARVCEHAHELFGYQENLILCNIFAWSSMRLKWWMDSTEPNCVERFAMRMLFADEMAYNL